jgi:hypothetical protein
MQEFQVLLAISVFMKAAKGDGADLSAAAGEWDTKVGIDVFRPESRSIFRKARFTCYCSD